MCVVLCVLDQNKTAWGVFIARTFGIMSLYLLPANCDSVTDTRVTRVRAGRTVWFCLTAPQRQTLPTPATRLWHQQHTLHGPPPNVHERAAHIVAALLPLWPCSQPARRGARVPEPAAATRAAACSITTRMPSAAHWLQRRSSTRVHERAGGACGRRAHAPVQAAGAAHRATARAAAMAQQRAAADRRRHSRRL